MRAHRIFEVTQKYFQALPLAGTFSSASSNHSNHLDLPSPFSAVHGVNEQQNGANESVDMDISASSDTEFNVTQDEFKFSVTQDNFSALDESDRHFQASQSTSEMKFYSLGQGELPSLSIRYGIFLG
jgi:hypothetical protein